MNVVFRVDASAEIGSGHLMRCLALAERLRKEKNVNISFISRDLQGNLSHIIQQKSFMVCHLPFAEADDTKAGYARWLAVSQEIDAKETSECILHMRMKPDWLIVDHYAIDATWERKVRPFVKRIFVIDDLADRVHECDALLDQSPDPKLENYYERLVPSGCKRFFGPPYALFREEFFQAQQSKMYKCGTHIPKVALVTFGGSDSTNETEKVLFALAAIDQADILIHVVVGASNPRREIIRKLSRKDSRVRYHCQIDYMAKLLQEVDFVIGAPGTSLWEWCFLRIPSLVIAVADNQKLCADYRTNPDICVYLGETENVSQEKIKNVLEEIFSGKRNLNNVRKAYKQYFPQGSRMEDMIEFITEEVDNDALGKSN